MADTMTPEQRRRCMSSIHSKNTKPEMIVRRWLWAEGYRYRVNSKKLPGKPDIVLRRFHTVIFVNGCFWHGHEGKSCFRVPKSNVDFWNAKIQRNRERDNTNYRILGDMGWNVLVIWECQLTPKRRKETLMALSYKLSRTFLGLQSKSYRIEEDSSLMVAESEIEYKLKDKEL